MDNKLVSMWEDLKEISNDTSGSIHRKLDSNAFECSISYDTSQKKVSYEIKLPKSSIQLPIFRGIHYQWSPNSLTILSSVDYGDVFFYLISDIHEEIKDEKNPDKVLRIIKNKCNRWKHFFETGISNKGLNKQMEMGLFGEVITLRLLIETYGPEVVGCWFGPLCATHDFAFPYQTIETKTCLLNRTSDDRVITIHGAEQLYAPTQIYLHVHVLEESVEEGISLSSLVKEMEELLSEEYRALFYERLASIGYNPSLGDKSKYIVNNSSFYQVTNDFPRLPIVNGIYNVTYQIDLDVIEEYKVGFEELALQV